MTAVDLTALREKAENATPGPWRVETEERHYDGAYCGGEWLPDVMCDGLLGREDAEFIAAASPDVILALVARVETAEQERDEAEARCDNFERLATEQYHDRRRAEARLAKVQELHEPDEFGCCEGCGSNEQGYAVVPYPCSTVKALGGEQ